MPKSKLTPAGIASVRLGGTKKRDYAESRLQAEIVKVLSLMGVYCMQIPNGEITDMSARKYQRLVAMGRVRPAGQVHLGRPGAGRRRAHALGGEPGRG